MERAFVWLYDQARPAKKYVCPSCGHRSLVKFRLMDAKYGELCEDGFGRCERINHCQFLRMPDEGEARPYETRIIHEPLPKIYIPDDLTRQSAHMYTQTAIFNYLVRLMPEKVDRIHDVMVDYRISKSRLFNGANVFWFMDSYGMCHYGQIKSFDDEGRTLKDRNGHQMINSVGSVLDPNKFDWVKAYREQGSKIDCFFGTHLYRNEDQVVGIVEAPATCLLMAVLYPDIVWMATGAAGYLKYHKLGSAIHAKEIILFPDYDEQLKTYSQWQEFAEANGCKCTAWWMMEEELYQPKGGDDYRDMIDHLFKYHKDVLINKYDYPNDWS